MTKLVERFDATRWDTAAPIDEMDNAARAIVEEDIATNWHPRDMSARPEQEWPPAPTVDSLSYWFSEAAKTGADFIDRSRYRTLIDTASYCLEAVPQDVAENVLYRMPVARLGVDPMKWRGSFNRLAAALWRPSVEEHEARRRLAGLVG